MQVGIEKLSDGTSFELVRVEGGTFLMGSDQDTKEEQIHKESVADFWIGKYLVTQALWENVMGENPSHFKAKNRPIESVKWDEVHVFLEKLNKITGLKYRLPSEVEWEYAARGGKFSCGFLYAGGNNLKEVGWDKRNSHQETKPVGLKLPNELGLYDMSGNVWEWCIDHWQDSDSSAKESRLDRRRVIRGGSWYGNVSGYAVYERSFVIADFRNDDVGFRLVRS